MGSPAARSVRRPARASAAAGLAAWTRARAGVCDRGSVTAWTVLSVLTVILAVGLVLDTGTAVRGWNHAHDVAASAARAGAQQLDLATYRRTGVIALDPAAATTAARAFLATAHATGTVTATATTVTVTVTASVPTQLLHLAGVGAFTVQATATATPVRAAAVGPAP